MSRYFRLSYLVTMVTILLGSHVSYTSSRRIDSSRSSQLQTNRIAKRDVVPEQTLGTGGLEMHCKLHPRNCPGGYMDKKGVSLIEKLRQIYPRFLYTKPSDSEVPIFEEHDRPTDIVSSLPRGGAERNVFGAMSRDDSNNLANRLLSLLMTSPDMSYPEGYRHVNNNNMNDNSQRNAW